MKRLFRFAYDRPDADECFGARWFASGSPAFAEDPATDLLASGRARLLVQALSPIHLFSGCTMRAVGRSLDAVDLCDVASLCAGPGLEGDVRAAATSTTINEGTSRGGPPGQDGLGDPDLPFFYLPFASERRPPPFLRHPTHLIH